MFTSPVRHYGTQYKLYHLYYFDTTYITISLKDFELWSFGFVAGEEEEQEVHNDNNENKDSESGINIIVIVSFRLRWTGHVARMDESRNVYTVLVGRPEGKRPLGGPRRRWEDNIKMDLREVGYDDRDWINLAQDRDRWRAYVRAAMNLRTHFDIGCHARIPTRNTILRWVASFRTTGSTLKKKSPGRNSIALRLSEATVRSRALRLLSLGPFEGRKEHLLRTSGERKKTKEETSEVLCVKCGIVWEQKHGHYDEMKRNEEKHLKCGYGEECSVKNDAETDQKEKKELAGSLAEKKLATEGCTGENGVNGRRVRGRRRYQMIDDIKICGSYAETKRKAANRNDWRMLGLE
ncbi:hypothetical protein ANN_17039 [Periplaneta americana]|uniref:DUF4817 domain-containing protein n=1 Tax=Periplaneta americana TaxID=6978 RepID=A0ABQ8ST84_PERAM|nr:hypothetical protein ANN_17039 [Periplaneta americana]